VEAPERSKEEHVVETIGKGMGGTKAGTGKPVFVDSSTASGEGKPKPKRGAVWP
jgi:hypothetical protein